MIQQPENFFIKVAQAITSLGAVIVILFLSITGMIPFSHTLFREVFPDTMDPGEKAFATWVMACVWEVTVLVTTVNARHLSSKAIPKAMAVASGIIVLFFIHAFDTSLSALELAERWFVGILAATFNYLFVELFNAKWEETIKSLNQQKEVARLESELFVSQSNLVQKDKIIDAIQSELNERKVKDVGISVELNRLKELEKKVHEDLTCPHCETVQESYGRLHVHKGHCSGKRLKPPKEGQKTLPEAPNA